MGFKPAVRDERIKQMCEDVRLCGGEMGRKWFSKLAKQRREADIIWQGVQWVASTAPSNFISARKSSIMETDPQKSP